MKLSHKKNQKKNKKFATRYVGFTLFTLKASYLWILGIVLLFCATPVLIYSIFHSIPSSQPMHMTETALSSDHLSYSQFQDVVQKLISIVQAQTPKQAIATLEQIAKANPAVFNDCHTLAHAVGRAAYDKYKNFNVAMQYQDDFCGSGYLHGVVEEKFKAALDIYAEMRSVCPPTNAGACYHAIGHGLMYFTLNDLPRSLQLCQTLSVWDQVLRCSEGVYMENFSTDLAAHPSKYIRPQDPLYPCPNQPSGAFKSVCYFYAPIYYLLLHPNDYSGALAECQKAEPGYVASCVDGVGSRTMKQNMSDPLFVEQVCDENSGKFTSSCIDGMVGYYVVNFSSTQKGNELCHTMQDTDQGTCYSSVHSRQDFFVD